MVKELSQGVEIDGCSVEQFFEIVYGDEEAVRHYHQRVNKAPEVVVSSWENGQREVQFSVPVKAPAIIRKAIGTDVVQVIDQQKYEWVDGALLLDSRPKPQVIGGEIFEISIHFVATNMGHNGWKTCQITARAKCQVQGMWAVVGSIEKAMYEQAQESIAQWLGFCSDFCGQKLYASKGLVVEILCSPGVVEGDMCIEGICCLLRQLFLGGSPQRLILEGMVESSIDEVDVFRDALDQGAEDSLDEGESSMRAMQREGLLLPPHSGMEYQDAVLMYLNNINDFAQQHYRSLEQYNGRLERVEKSVERICQVLTEESEHRARQRAGMARMRGVVAVTGVVAVLTIAGLALTKRTRG